jgi:hypothetical protein
VTTRPHRERLAAWAVPTLLLAVAGLQMGRAAVLDQSSYAGFGFGMFATYENELSRWTEVTATMMDGTEVSVRPDAALDLAVQEVPTDSNVEALAASVLRSDPEFVSVHAAVWTVAVDGRPMQLEKVLMVESTVERSP